VQSYADSDDLPPSRLDYFGMSRNARFAPKPETLSMSRCSENQ